MLSIVNEVVVDSIHPCLVLVRGLQLLPRARPKPIFSCAALVRTSALLSSPPMNKEVSWPLDDEDWRFGCDAGNGQTLIEGLIRKISQVSIESAFDVQTAPFIGAYGGDRRAFFGLLKRFLYVSMLRVLVQSRWPLWRQFYMRKIHPNRNRPLFSR